MPMNCFSDGSASQTGQYEVTSPRGCVSNTELLVSPTDTADVGLREAYRGPFGLRRPPPPYVTLAHPAVSSITDCGLPFPYRTGSFVAWTRRLGLWAV